MINEDAWDIIKTHQCPQCKNKSRLIVRWTGKIDEPYCVRCNRTTGFIRKRK